MIHITRKMRAERGCDYCADKVRRNIDEERKVYCIHRECIYHELDKYDSFEDYFKNETLQLSPNIGRILELFREKNEIIRTF